ncbi:MAG: hypothetical protein H0X64_01300 [Gemmatimonadaceae bacterium]|nr:hypothetical protein [Gemmatimonadaceae bacterium]
MQMSADWGWSWTIAAYVVSWTVFLGYAHYVRTRSRVALEALQREGQHAGEGA